MGQRFDQSEWVTDIATATLTGIAGMVVVAAIAPSPNYAEAALTGGIGGLVIGLLTVPIKWLLGRRPGRDDDDDEK